MMGKKKLSEVRAEVVALFSRLPRPVPACLAAPRNPRRQGGPEPRRGNPGNALRRAGARNTSKPTTADRAQTYATLNGGMECGSDASGGP